MSIKDKMILNYALGYFGIIAILGVILSLIFGWIPSSGSPHIIIGSIFLACWIQKCLRDAHKLKEELKHAYQSGVNTG